MRKNWQILKSVSSYLQVKVIYADLDLLIV